MRNVQKVRKVDGKVEDEEKLISWIRKFLDKMPDGEMLMEFTSTSRTDAQNRFYWVWMGIIGRHLGMRNEDIHKVFKEMFLPKEDYFVMIKKKQITSTTDMDKDQMTVYLDSIRQYASEEMGIILPDAEEYKHKNNN